MGSGKDTAALIVQQAYPGLDFKHVSFANALKRAYTAMTNNPFRPNREFKDSICPVFKIPVREVLQRIGTDALRDNFEKDIWIKILEKENPTGNLVISDVRFENEAFWIRKNGGTVIRIERTDDMAKSIWANHESENAIKGDFTIKNDFGPNGLEEFKSELHRILFAITGIEVHVEEAKFVYTSMLHSISRWMHEFNVKDGGRHHAFEIYLKLIDEELKEVRNETFGSQRQAEEICDLLWVTMALALCVIEEDEIISYMKRLFASNMSKATTSKALIDRYCQETGHIPAKTARGRWFAMNKETGKICKGPVYEKFNLDGIF